MELDSQILQDLKDLTRSVNATVNPDSAIELFFAGCHRFINFDYGGIFFKDTTNNIFSLYKSEPANHFKLPATHFIDENDLLKQIVTDKSAVLINNLAVERDWQDNYFTTDKKEKSFLGIPLVQDKSIEGILVILSTEVNAFSAKDRMILEHMAELMVATIITARNLKKSMLAIKQIAKDLHKEPGNKKQIISKIVKSAVELTHSDFGCIALYDPHDEQLVCRYGEFCQLFDKARESGCRFRLDDNKKLAVKVFNQRKGELVENIEREGLVSNYSERTHQIVISQAAVPLLKDTDQAIGVLKLDSDHESHFSASDLELLKALAELSVSALENSQTFIEHARMIKKLSLLSEAANVLLTVFEYKPLEEKFDFIVMKSIEILDAELCDLWLAGNGKVKLVTDFYVTKELKVEKRKRERIERTISSEPGSGLTGYIASQKKVFNEYGDVLRNHPAIKKKGTSDFLSTPETLSELSYPMLDEKGELLGLLTAFNKRDEHGRHYTDRGFSTEFDEPLMKILTTKLLITIKNAELVNELEKFKLIIECTPDPVVTAALDGTINYMNQGAIQLFGDIRGQKASKYYCSDGIYTGLDRAHEVMRQLYNSPTGSVQDYETRFFDKNGDPVPVSATFSLLKDINKKDIGTIGIIKDLRKLKQLIQIGNTLLSLYENNEILAKITEICINLRRAIRSYSILYDEAGECFHALNSKIPGEKFPKENVKITRGIIQYVFANQAPYKSKDLAQEPPELADDLFPEVKSKIVVPINRVDSLTKKTTTVGAIVVDSNDTDAFSLTDLDFLSTLATQAAAAIENANLIKTKTKIITELTAFKKLQETIATSQDIDQILESVLDIVYDILGFDYATISKIEPKTAMIGTIAGRNVEDDFLDIAWHPLDSNDIQAWVVRNKEIVKLAGWDDRLDKAIYDRYDHQNLVRIYLPIISRNEAFGTLETGYYKTHRQAITEAEIEILKKVVNLAGIGIDQVYLLGEQNELVDQLQALNEASIYIQSSRTEEEAIKHIFNSLNNIGYSQGMLSLVNETTEKIEGRYALGAGWEKIRRETKRELKGDDILAITIRKQESVLSEDCPSDPTCNQEAIRKAGIKSQYVIPLIIDNKAIGTLQIDLSDKQGLVRGPREVLKRRMEVLATFASQIAIAIRNARNQEIIDLLQQTLMETAHEFRSPLHNIIAQIGGLKAYFIKGSEKEKEIDEIFKIISEEAHRASQQMENTLLYSEKTRGLVGYNFEDGYIQDIMQNCAASYRLRALERGISISITPGVKSLPQFKFDKHKMEQVINNLLDNGVKYSHYNRLIQIHGFDDGSNIHLDIWDKGLGIPEEEFDNIFQGFTRGSHKDKTRYIPGTGLGLKISREIVNGHGGKIMVKSTPFFDDPRKIKEYDGYDTIFTIVLPKKPKEK